MVYSGPNTLATVLPNSGGSFGVGPNDIQALAVTTGAIAANAVTAAKLADATVTTTQLAANLLQYIAVTLTPTQIKNLYATPIQIIAAPGTGKSIVVVQALARFAYTTPQYTAGGAIQLQYDNTTHAGGTAVLNTLAAAVVNAAASSDTILTPVDTGAVTATQNKGIFAAAATQEFATGSVSTLTFHVWYQIV